MARHKTRDKNIILICKDLENPLLIEINVFEPIQIRSKKANYYEKFIKIARAIQSI